MFAQNSPSVRNCKNLNVHGSDPQGVLRMCEKTYGAAGVGSLNPGQVLHVRVEDVHLLH